MSRFAGALQLLLGVALAVVATQLAAQPAPVGSAAPTGSAVPAGSALALAEAEPPPSYEGPVVRYTMRAKLDAETHRIDGDATIEWQNRSSTPQSELYLHLYLNAFKNERSVFFRSKAGVGFRGAGLPEHWGWVKVDRLYSREHKRDLWPDADKHSPGEEDDETDIRVPLPEAVEPGGRLTLELKWRSQLPNVLFRTGFDGSFHMAGQWFPKLARLESDGSWAHFPFQRLSEFYADYGDYDVHITAPAGFVVGATGKLQAKPDEGGDGVTHHYAARRVHDFAFTAWDRFEEEERQIEGGPLVRCLFPPSYAEVGELELDAVTAALERFGKWYGEYPYDTLTLVHPPKEAPEAGGMEYPTLITTGGQWFTPALGVRMVELVTIHELGHQWFYGLVGSNENRWPFLDEGLTQFAELDAAEELHPGSGLAQLGGLSVSLPAAVRVGMLQSKSRGPVARPANDFPTGSDYGSQVYARTATLMETLARVYGRDVVRAALGRYAREQRFQHPTPDDLLAVMATDLGEEVAKQMRLALFDEGWVDYEVAAVDSKDVEAFKGVFGDPDSPTDAPKAGEGKRGYVMVRRYGTLTFPVEIELHDAAGKVTQVSWDGKGDHFVIPYEGDQELAAAVVDPSHRILLDEDLSNNARRLHGRRGTAWRTLGHTAWLTQLLMGVMAP